MTSLQSASTVNVDIGTPFCACGLPAQKKLVTKPDSKYRGSQVWLCSKGTKQQGGCGFFKANDDPQPSAAATQVVANSHVVPRHSVHQNMPTTASHSATVDMVPAQRKRSADDAGLDSVAPEAKRVAAANDFGAVAVVASTDPSTYGTNSVQHDAMSGIDFGVSSSSASSDFGAPATVRSTPAPSSSYITTRDLQQGASNTADFGVQTTSHVSSIPANQSIMCKCGLPANLLTSRKQNENMGRKFYSCAKPIAERCRFFKWEDEAAKEVASNQFPPHDRQVVRHDALSKQMSADDAVGNVMGRDMSALNEYVGMAKARGFTCFLASPFDYLYSHRELRLVKGAYNQEDFWVVVRPASAGVAPGENGLWLQIHGVRPDDEGYIISGQSHFIAFQTATEYIICSRRALWAYVDRHVVREHVPSADLADHKYYKEGPLNEAVTWVSVDALKAWRDYTIGIPAVIVDTWPRQVCITPPLSTLATMTKPDMTLMAADEHGADV